MMLGRLEIKNTRFIPEYAIAFRYKCLFLSNLIN